MSAHAYHPPEQAHLILKDGCGRCAELAEEPWFTVDRERLQVLVRIAVAWEDEGGASLPGSDAERRACQRILDVLGAARAMSGLPDRRAVVAALEDAAP